MGGSSGLIIAFVVAVWAAYFVPLVLRRYDEASKNASVETSGSSSRVIARPKQVVPAPAVVSAKTTDRPVVESAAESAAEPAAGTVAKAPARRSDRPAARLAAKRRRRTLLTLLAVTAVVTGLVVAAVIAPYWIAVPVSLVVAWLVACRIQVRGELGLAGLKAPKIAKLPKISRLPKIARLPKISRPSRVSRKSSSFAVDEEDTIIVSGQFEDINPGRRHQMEDLPLEATALDDQIVIAVPSVSSTGDALWDPLPVTLPTYVTKPRAGRTVRTIDFGQAGAWTSGHIEGEDVELPHRADDAGDQRRAVGH